MSDRNDGDPGHDRTDRLLSDTLAFSLGMLVEELSRDIDLRAMGRGRNAFSKFFIYLFALLRDLVRIPLHSARGIGQARFRFRVSFITNTAVPMLTFFRERYPLPAEQSRRIDEAVRLLERGAMLTRDGRVHALDAWYATMDEFAELTDDSKGAARILEEVAEQLRDPPPVRGA